MILFLVLYDSTGYQAFSHDWKFMRVNGGSHCPRVTAASDKGDAQVAVLMAGYNDISHVFLIRLKISYLSYIIED